MRTGKPLTALAVGLAAWAAEAAAKVGGPGDSAGRLALRLDGTSRTEQQTAADEALARRLAAERGEAEIRGYLHTAEVEARRVLHVGLGKSSLLVKLRIGTR